MGCRPEEAARPRPDTLWMQGARTKQARLQEGPFVSILERSGEWLRDFVQGLTLYVRVSVYYYKEYVSHYATVGKSYLIFGMVYIYQYYVYSNSFMF